YGLSCFERTRDEEYSARTFNFWIFPQPAPQTLGVGVPEAVANRRFVCEAGSLAFLSEQGFDFNTCIGKGIPYIPARQRDSLLAQLDRTLERGGPDRFSQQARVAVTDAADAAFLAELASQVEAWLAEGQSGSPELALAPATAFRRLLTYQLLGGERFCKPAEGGGGGDGHRGFIVRKVERRGGAPALMLSRAATAEAAAELAERLQREAREAVVDAAGFAAVFDMMRASGKPAVVHNGAFDVAYSLYSFGDGWLPPAWRGYREMARTWLPGGVYDTKLIARQLPEVLGRDTSLSALYAGVVDGEKGAAAKALLAAGGMQGTRLPRVVHAAGFDKYRGLAAGTLAHEAGYDAFMTGAAFACLLPLLRAKAAADPSALPAPVAAAAAAAAPLSGPLAPAAGFLGRMNLTYSDLPYVCLFEEDPIPERPKVVYLTWEEGALSEGEEGGGGNGGGGGGGGGGAAEPFRRGDAARSLTRRVQRALPPGEDGRPARVRLTLLSRTAALAELEDEASAQALCGELPPGGGGVAAAPYASYAAERHARFVSEAARAAGEGEGGGGRRGGGEDAQRAAKRQRVASQLPAAGEGEGEQGAAAAGEGGGPRGSSCSIM
ncbi:poly(A)-specific ribonuclease, partial [Raphidocelis subcapitata]